MALQPAGTSGGGTITPRSSSTPSGSSVGSLRERRPLVEPATFGGVRRYAIPGELDPKPWDGPPVSGVLHVFLKAMKWPDGHLRMVSRQLAAAACRCCSSCRRLLPPCPCAQPAASLCCRCCCCCGRSSSPDAAPPCPALPPAERRRGLCFSSRRRCRSCGWTVSWARTRCTTHPRCRCFSSARGRAVLWSSRPRRCMFVVWLMAIGSRLLEAHLCCVNGT